MEEELHYVAVTFKPSVVSDVKTNDEDAVIYDAVKTEEHTTCLFRQRHPSVVSEKGKKASLCTHLHLVAAGLGFFCIILTSVVVALSVHFNTVMSEQLRENQNLTVVNHQLRKEMSDMQRQTKELSRELGGLNWTIGVIMEYVNFPVHTYCPSKVCKPCEDGWVLFQSNCYYFGTGWQTWSMSQEVCRKVNANLVVIQSQQEQEFINKHATYYDYKNYGYWIGMTEETAEKWLWVDGSHPTVQYWVTQQVGHGDSCVRILPVADPLSNWNKASCHSGNRWICEKRALIKPE